MNTETKAEGFGLLLMAVWWEMVFVLLIFGIFLNVQLKEPILMFID